MTEKYIFKHAYVKNFNVWAKNVLILFRTLSGNVLRFLCKEVTQEWMKLSVVFW